MGEGKGSTRVVPTRILPRSHSARVSVYRIPGPAAVMLARVLRCYLWKSSATRFAFITNVLYGPNIDMMK